MRHIEPGGRVMDRAWLRDHDNNTHTGEALLIACLLHAKGTARKGQDMEDLQRIMRDKNAKEQTHGRSGTQAIK